MPKVDRNQFNQSLASGVNLRDAKLAERLNDAGVSLDQVKVADLNGDGMLSSREELAKAFAVVDGFDRNGAGDSFERAGKSGAVYDAFVGSVMPGEPASGRFAERIVSAALDRAAKHGPSYGKSEVPVSPHPLLTSNRNPESTKLNWLKNHWKCNQFVGDALTQAGVQTPLYKMQDGSYHYAPAERWPSFTHLFDRVTDASKMQVGDLVVRDYPGSGDATAHIEIVTSVNPFRSTGAHMDAAYEQAGANWTEGGTYNPSQRAFDVNGNTVYVLRPKVAR
jgi:hypothetical protein